MNLIYLVCLTLIYLNLLVKAQSNSTKFDCKAKGTNTKLDDIFAKLYTYGDSGRSFPLTPDQATLYCSETKELLQTAEVYIKNCLKEYPRRLLSIMVKTVRTQSRALCNNKESKRMKELFIGADCTNAAKKQYQKCINDVIDTLNGTKYLDDKQKLPLLCCGTQRMQRCFHDESIKLNPICNEFKIETSLRFLDSIQGNMLSVLCMSFDDSADTCDKLVYPQKTKKQRRYKSIVLPMIQVLDSIKDVKARGI